MHSYLNMDGYYLPLFEFPDVSIEKNEVEEEYFDEHVIARRRAEEFDVFVGNSLKRIEGCHNLILIGLSDTQKSYLKFINKFKTIEIYSMQDVDSLLGGIVSSIVNELVCSPKNVLQGLFKAYKTNSKLIVREDAPQANDIEEKKEG